MCGVQWALIVHNSRALQSQTNQRWFYRFGFPPIVSLDSQTACVDNIFFILLFLQIYLFSLVVLITICINGVAFDGSNAVRCFVCVCLLSFSDLYLKNAILCKSNELKALLHVTLSSPSSIWLATHCSVGGMKGESVEKRAKKPLLRCIKDNLIHVQAYNAGYTLTK